MLPSAVMDGWTMDHLWRLPSHLTGSDIVLIIWRDHVMVDWTLSIACTL